MRKILIIDSDPEFRRIVADFLEARNFQVSQALSGNEGLKMQEKENPDLILLSRELLQPDGTVGPDGLRILKTIKLDKKLNKLPVILMSSEASDKDFERYRKLRVTAEDYVTKPFEDTDLIRRVENLIGFDVEDGADAVREAVEDVMDENIGNIFDADKEELGLSTSAATRKELSELMKQVGAEMERHEEALQWELPPRKEEDQLQSLKNELEALRQRLSEESKRSREAKEMWKKALKTIDGRLKKSQGREENFREAVENMRRKFADIELDHTMELERLQSEKRRAEEELRELKDQEKDAQLMRPEIFKDLRRALKILNKIMKQIDKGIQK